MPANDSILSVNNLDVFYGDFQALFDVSLNINEGEIVSIIGANGSGKSTLMRTICGLSKPKSGEVIFRDSKISGLLPNQIVPLGITMVPEGRRLFPRLTINENLRLGAYSPKVRNKTDSLLKAIFELFPVLEERKSQLASTLSGGEQQMLAIGRALMSDPKVLLMDEVSLGLSPIVVNDVYRKVKEINQQGITILLVDQNVTRSVELSNKTYILRQGQVVLEKVSSELSEDEVKKAYFGLK